jgi:Flp pilus assembly protein TadB
MPNDSSTNDPKTIWQNQPTEPSKMTLVMIRHKTQQLHTKSRREIFGGVALSMFLVGFCVFGIRWVHVTALRALFALDIAWALAAAAQYFVNRRSLSGSGPSDVSLGTSLQSYRREVERQGYILGRVLLWSFGPAVLGIGTLSAQMLMIAWRRGAFRNTVPFFTLLGLWFVGIFVLRVRQQRELKREIDQLNEVESSIDP